MTFFREQIDIWVKTCRRPSQTTATFITKSITLSYPSFPRRPLTYFPPPTCWTLDIQPKHINRVSIKRRHASTNFSFPPKRNIKLI